jgi:hypothetical protein
MLPVYISLGVGFGLIVLLAVLSSNKPDRARLLTNDELARYLTDCSQQGRNWRMLQAAERLRIYPSARVESAGHCIAQAAREMQVAASAISEAVSRLAMLLEQDRIERHAMFEEQQSKVQR